MNMNSSSSNIEDNAFRKKNSSSRKVLPTKPSTSINSRLSMSGKMVERPSSESERGIKLYEPFLLEYAIIAEFVKLKENLVPGVYISPAGKNKTLWYGVMFVREGHYRGGIFRFQVQFSESFVDGECPRVVFSPQVYHPAVSPDTGELNVAAVFPSWRKDENHVWQLLQYAKDVFTQNNGNYIPLNEAAAQLWKDDPNEFQQRAAKCVAACRHALNETTEDDLNFIKLQPFSIN